jgi:CheY-like chemotaxis protein
MSPSAHNAPEIEGTRLANRLGTMRLPPPASNPVESVTLDIDEEVATLRGPTGRVLLLEDRDDFRKVLHDYLALRNYEVTSVPSGVEGLREIMKGAFDLIICDMMMPQIGGEMFYWAVTRVRPANAQRFIFFTGHQNNPAIKFFFRRVNATVLTKPFRLAELDSAIHDVLLKLR